MAKLLSRVTEQSGFTGFIACTYKVCCSYTVLSEGFNRAASQAQDLHLRRGRKILRPGRDGDTKDTVSSRRSQRLRQLTG